MQQQRYELSCTWNFSRAHPADLAAVFSSASIGAQIREAQQSRRTISIKQSVESTPGKLAV
jgi:hypothetical protein